MELPKIQYVTHPNEDYSNLSWIDALKNGGVNWIQLRIKEEDLSKHHPDLHYKHTFLEIADLVREKTKELGMILTINDHPEIARFCTAEGLHFGQTDNIESEDLTGFNVVGGTANNFSEVRNLPLNNLNYLGVGPFSKTDTKSTIKEVLGTEGYRSLIEEMRLEGISLPVYAIGGIKVNDIGSLIENGVYGIAVSGLFHHAQFDEDIIKSCSKYFNNGK